MCNATGSNIEWLDSKTARMSSMSILIPKPSLRRRLISSKTILSKATAAIFCATATGAKSIKSVQNNVTFVADPFNVPQAIRNEKTDVTPIASQWILRRVAGNVSYQDLGRPPSIEWSQLANGVYKITGSSHATVVVEMRD